MQINLMRFLSKVERGMIKMKTYYMKIRDKYIKEVRDGVKKHEYRLASPDRKAVRVGDNIILISNTDKKSYVRTTVKRITTYRDWKEALEKNWQNDFKNLYSTLEEALRECYRFYPKDEVDKYGIISFDIEPCYVDCCDATVLLDTNIVIKRESVNNVSFEVVKLFNWFEKKSVAYYVHSSSKEEISTYQDSTIRNNLALKLNSYNELPHFPTVSDEILEKVLLQFSDDANGQIDNKLLKEVYSDNVGLLLTDDKLMLKKAEMLYMRDKVMTSSELLAKFESKFPKNIEYKMLAVKLVKFEDVDLNDAFFDSLREDYEGQKFDQWFKKKGKESAYVFEDKDGLKGFLYLKIELPSEPDYLKITPVLSSKKRLKIGTFKIDSSGFRLGERFLKIIFDNASKNAVDEIYVTLFEDKRDDVIRLKSLLEQWGFVRYGYKNANHELVLVKTMKEYRNELSPKLNYPLVKTKAYIYILPIKAEYHTDLFPDKILKNEDMHLYEENLAHRYAIEKIYLTGAFNIEAKPGDLILVYRMSDKWYKNYSSVITGLAIVQEIVATKDVEECISLCKNRSIFNEPNIRALYRRCPTVVKILDFTTFENSVTLQKLRELGVVDATSGPRPFTAVTKEQFDTIYKLGMEE